MKRILATTFALLTLTSLCRAEDGFERKTVDYGNWNSGFFADATTVRTPARFIYLSGQGSEDEKTGEIRYPGDIAAQCKYAWEKIEKSLKAQGAAVTDIVKATTYVTQPGMAKVIGKCRAEAMKGAPATPHTFLVVQGLAWPGMVMEVDVVAAVAP
ncbi:RidA family protein [Mangrovicella endophytica]|uniref:RidA family protein n=1 Tax=Mangrovicella endophytica TaxID=2066697 RepID=UPI0013000345|nr:RidA family protein [Mangrovicella endophytica]